MIPVEHVDWTPFDIVDAYRNRHNFATFREDLRQYFTHGKPVAVAEAGCCTFRSAGDWGTGGWTVIEEGGTVKPGTVRDEGEQVRYMDDLMAVFEEVGMDTVFWFSFAGFELPHRPDPRYDLDLGSYGIVKMLDGSPGRACPGMP
ncbi:hypothetical protein [Nonomuraea sp. NPDC049695]|uniref:hypothetical protein n=1 Tax=Nonomuraea sp. NPDC049695 TaxID=3154734 RepID=UPI0034495A44